MFIVAQYMGRQGCFFRDLFNGVGQNPLPFRPRINVHVKIYFITAGTK
jgi:hypothetical protein